jgi:signal transduction histidine kinase
MNDKSKNIAQELYARNAELLEFNRILSLIQTIDAAMYTKEKDVAAYLDEVVEKIVTESELSLFGIFIFDGNEILYSSMGILSIDTLNFEKYPPHFKESFNPRSLLTPTETSKETYSVDSVFELENAQYELRNKVFDLNSGLECVMIFAERENELTSFQEHLIQRLVSFLGTILENVILSEQLRLTSNRLKKSNDKLKALDEAKDEFVSMASHQLRTPLTSIKGYISMVLEGDAGEINETQKQMLGQAFFSSQRMVYLISDLLNVSRLKTGKFVIEPKPAYLPDIVESEMQQLIEGASAKNLTLSYTKPKEFPTLLLDEMKIRQVIMNFTDNAIYYTPSGGKIQVSLKETPKAVEFTVKDSGIGVPKEQQHKLFEKFFRADNARKSRPDGTGLGLFMARKVIVAQGGSIIFQSAEGKGSTFGFSFPKEKLEVKVTPATDN